MSAQDPYRTPASDAALSDDRGTGEEITEGMFQALAGTRVWIMIVAVMLLMGAGLMFLGVMGLAFVAVADAPGIEDQPFPVWVMVAMYGVLGFMYLIPGYGLIRYFIAIMGALRHRDAASFQDALVRQKNFWRNITLMMFTVLVLYCGGVAAFVAYTMQGMPL